MFEMLIIYMRIMSEMNVYSTFLCFCIVGKSGLGLWKGRLTETENIAIMTPKSYQTLG